MLYYHVDDNLSKAQGVNGILDRFIINYFRELINNDKDWVIAVSLLVRWDWQTHNKIHQYIFLVIGRNWLGLKVTV